MYRRPTLATVFGQYGDTKLQYDRRPRSCTMKNNYSSEVRAYNISAILLKDLTCNFGEYFSERVYGILGRVGAHSKIKNTVNDIQEKYEAIKKLEQVRRFLLI